MRLLVERRKRFVQQQYAVAARVEQKSREGQSLPLTEGELGRWLVELGFQQCRVQRVK